MDKTLLLVDDEASLLRALERLLRADGYRLLTAGSGAQALALLAANDVQVILSDQRMPGMRWSDRITWTSLAASSASASAPLPAVSRR